VYCSLAAYETKNIIKITEGSLIMTRQSKNSENWIQLREDIAFMTEEELTEVCADACVMDDHLNEELKHTENNRKQLTLVREPRHRESWIQLREGTTSMTKQELLEARSDIRNLCDCIEDEFEVRKDNKFCYELDKSYPAVEKAVSQKLRQK
jgi:hypothetical protein